MRSFSLKQLARRLMSPNLQRVISLTVPERKQLILASFFLILSTIGTLSFPRAAGKLLDEALHSSTKTTVDLAHVDRLALSLIAIFAVTALASALRFYFFSRAGERIVSRLRTNLFSSLLFQETAFFDTQKSGELASRLSSDATVLQTAVSGNISQALRNGTIVLGALVMLLLTSARLTLSMLAVVPPIALSAVIYGRRVRKLSRDAQDALARSSDVAVEAIAGIRTVKSFAAEKEEIVRYKSAISNAVSLSIQRISYSASFFGIAFFAAFSAGAFVFWYGARLVASGELTAGNLISFLFNTMQLAFGLAALAELWTDLQRAIGAAERVFELLDRTPAIARGGEKLPQVNGDIRFENITFFYPSRPQFTVLKDFNLNLNPGEVTAIVGHSGAGKSTLASLLYRLYDPQEGTIFFDGVPYRTIDPEYLRRQVGVVAQEPLLFSTSIGENIRYGRLEATNDQIVQAAEAANARDFIESFPNSYDTLVGERGVQLSGGQKQRVAIARAVLKDPRILVLDEATSALDAESEHLVQDALDKLLKGRTTLIIAHRLSTVQHAHRVVVLEHGHIVQVGPHATLMHQEGPYRRLVERQFAA